MSVDILPLARGATFGMVEMNVPKINGPRRRVLSVMNLQSEDVRLQTFTNWPSKNVTKEDLAKSGFVYSHKSDQVKCFFCKGSIVCWEAGDDVHEEHKKSYKQCPLVNSKTAINIPKGDKAYENINEFMNNLLDTADPPKNRNKYETDAKRVTENTNSTRFNEYVSVQKRLRSFEKAPSCLPSAEKMAEAGFFYTTFADLTQCYSCGGGVINWNPKEDPKAVHDMLYQNCSLAAESPETVNFPKEKRKKIRTTDDVKDDLNRLSWVKKIQKVYSDEVVTEALVEDLQTHGSLPYNVNQAMEVVDDYENMH